MEGGTKRESGRREFMCLGRVKGTRVATSAADRRRTAGCNGERNGEARRKGKDAGGENPKGWMHLHVTRTLSRQIPFSGSFPTRGRDEDCFRTGGIRGIPNSTKLWSLEPRIRESDRFYIGDVESIGGRISRIRNFWRGTSTKIRIYRNWEKNRKENFFLLNFKT